MDVNKEEANANRRNPWVACMSWTLEVNAIMWLALMLRSKHQSEGLPRFWNYLSRHSVTKEEKAVRKRKRLQRDCDPGPFHTRPLEIRGLGEPVSANISRL